MSQETAVKVKNNEFDNMVRFAFRLTGVNILILAAVGLIGLLQPEEITAWLALVVLGLIGINLFANLIVFYLSLVGLFKSTLKWRAALALLFSLVLFALYLLIIAATTMAG
ncbi:hypothetical protein [Serratia rubidaea]|uniref:hypothetical protein n=1 Tax=Serratia rubidaea TaxID=61652 RepID=UPI0022B9134C|nr:hypothetical protein [Serratia rubidaea]MCR0999363.1 hypothetical protein [Serratia rubidaea]WBF44257.1 hypothetical protein OLD77_16595 [Serratia rubidaea]